MTLDLINDSVTITDRVVWLLLRIIIFFVPYTECPVQVETFPKSGDVSKVSRKYSASRIVRRNMTDVSLFLSPSHPLIQPFAKQKPKSNLTQIINPLEKKYSRENGGHYLPAN